MHDSHGSASNAHSNSSTCVPVPEKVKSAFRRASGLSGLLWISVSGYEMAGSYLHV